MKIALTPELEELIDAKLASGPYRSPIEVIGDALRLLDEHDRRARPRWQELQREIRRGLEQLDGGEKAPLDMAEVKRKARELRIRGEQPRTAG